MNIHLKEFEKSYIIKKNNFPDFKPGYIIDVAVKIQNEDKVRLQHFKGIVIQRRHKNTNGETFTVRGIIDNVAVEKVFHILSPLIDSITVIKKKKVRRARLFYLRDKKNLRVD